ncbi:MAG: hypothetical protein Q9221_001428 [Calogaya cf. arnoldii]
MQASHQYSTTARRTLGPESLQHSGDVISKRLRQNKFADHQVNRLPKRDLGDYHVQRRWLKTFSLLVPVHIAATHIIEFFNEVFGLIELGAWSDEPLIPQWRFFLLGDFELSFYAFKADIPLDFVQDYVIDKISAIKSGFAAEYFEYNDCCFRWR